jgi:hypothetical protein
MLMRLKTLTVGEREIKIGALTVKQVEELVTSSPAQDINRSYKIIATGLNNGDPSAEWTAERVPEEMDYGMIFELQKEILLHSNLALEKVSAKPSSETTEDNEQGEAEAASIRTQ